MDNIYKAPEADLSSEKGDYTESHFPVSIRKLWIMSLATVGIYSIVWNYYHWVTLKHTDSTRSSIWPVPRAIFSIFFVHSLYQSIVQTCQERRPTEKWSLSGMAALYIVCTVLGNVMDQVALYLLPGAVLIALSIAFIYGYTYSMAEAQKLANLANNDVEENVNNTLTPANYLWIIIGAFLWFIVIVGYIGTEIAQFMTN